MVQPTGNEQDKNNPLMPKGDKVNSGQGFVPQQDPRYKSIPSSGLEPDEDYQPRAKKAMDINWMSFLVSIVVSLVVVMVMNSIIMPVAGKKAYRADITRLETDLVTMRSTETELTNRIKVLENSNETLSSEITAQLSTALGEIDDKVTGLENSINQKVSGYINSSAASTMIQTAIQSSESSLRVAINNVANDLTILSNRVSTSIPTGITTQITDLTNRLNDLMERVDELEEDDPVISQSEPITVSMKQQSGYLYYDSSENVSVGTLRVTIANTSGKDVEDIIIGIGFTLPYTVAPTSLVLTGGTLGWSAYPYNLLYQRTNGWGYTIKANSKLTFDVIAKFNNIGQPQYTAEIYLEEWSYK
jgi:hypothetical protein